MAKQKSSLGGAELVRVIAPQDLALSEESKIAVSPAGYSQCVRALLQNWRQGTVSCKGRSDVSFSNKKPWKQKGTGRARAGSARSPLWRKGGVTFGPQPRIKELLIPKSLKKQVCNSLLWHYLTGKKIVSIDWSPTTEVPKTAHAYRALQQAGLEDKKLIMFVSPLDFKVHASFSNIPNVKMLLFDQANAYDLSFGEFWLVLDKDMDAFKEMVSRWI